MPARQLKHAFAKPGLDAEKARHFGDPPADDLGAVTQAFQPKGELVPHLVSDDLPLGILVDKSDFRRAHPFGQLLDIGPIVEDLPLPVPIWRELSLHVAQQGALAAARPAAHHNELRGLDAKGELAERRLITACVGKTHAFETNDFHEYRSPISIAIGRLSSTPYAR